MAQAPREAVALEYGRNQTPVVIAKGREEVAEQIIAEAARQGVYVSEDAHLVALLSQLELNDEIPPQLYRLVAVVLAWAYWFKGMQPGDEKN
jgi:flagellar biosynthesis protein